VGFHELRRNAGGL